MKSDSLGQLILTGVPGLELDSETAALFRRVQPGGFILFGRNIQSARQLRKLIDDLRDLSEIEPIITIDQEGGRVSRLRLIGNEPPNAQQLRDRDDVALVRQHGEITGRLLRLFGFNLDLCPVLDISFDDEADNSLRGRCYGKTVEQVKTSLNPGLTIHGIVLTMFDARNNLSGQVVADVRSFMGEKVYDTIIPRNVRISEAPSHGKPVLLYDLKCTGSQAYVRLASEIIQRERGLRAA